MRASIIERGEDAPRFRRFVVKVTDNPEFVRSGNREIMRRPQRERSNAPTSLSELTEGKKRFVDAIVDGVWAMYEQASYVTSFCYSLQSCLEEVGGFITSFNRQV